LKSLASAVAEILNGTAKFWGAPLDQGHAHFSSAWDFIMGLGKPQRLAKFEVAGFIYYGNIRELFLKIGINQNAAETDFTVGFADPMFPIRCATAVELLLQQMGEFYEKPHFTTKNFIFWEAVKWGLKVFAPNYQKARPYVKSGRTNRLAYVAVTLF